MVSVLLTSSITKSIFPLARIFVAEQDDIAAATAVPAVGTAFRQILLATETQTAVSAVAGTQKNFRFIDKHDGKGNSGSRGNANANRGNLVGVARRRFYFP